MVIQQPYKHNNKALCIWLEREKCSLTLQSTVSFLTLRDGVIIFSWYSRTVFSVYSNHGHFGGISHSEHRDPHNAHLPWLFRLVHTQLCLSELDNWLWEKGDISMNYWIMELTAALAKYILF